jgi:hypothetical protein
VTILEIKIDAILDSDVWGLRHPSGLSIHPSRNEPIIEQKKPLLQSTKNGSASSIMDKRGNSNEIED